MLMIVIFKNKFDLKFILLKLSEFLEHKYYAYSYFYQSFILNDLWL